MRKEKEKNSNGDTVAIYTVFSSVEWHCEQTSAQTVGHQQWPLSSSRGAKEVTQAVWCVGIETKRRLEGQSHCSPG